MSAFLDVADPVAQLADRIESLNLSLSTLANQYRYASLPLCVIDAVFSISVRYGAVQSAVKTFCEYNGWAIFAPSRYERGAGEHSVSDLLEIGRCFGTEHLAHSVFRNRQRTSTRNGILKAASVLQFAQALLLSGINSFTDLNQERLEAAEVRILGLQGQGSGIAFDYFKMLAGDDSIVKPDRMIIRFIKANLKLTSDLKPRQASLLIRQTAAELTRRGARITPLQLDHAIWNHQRRVSQSEVLA